MAAREPKASSALRCNAARSLPGALPGVRQSARPMIGAPSGWVVNDRLSLSVPRLVRWSRQ